jgi:hypothetical protein
MKSLSIVLFLLAACGLAVAKEVPLPRAKPLSATDLPSLVPAPEVLPPHDAEAWPSDCALRLAEIARFAHQPTHGYRMCQWDVREPEAVAEMPIPLPKPVALRSQSARCPGALPKWRCPRSG